MGIVTTSIDSIDLELPQVIELINPKRISENTFEVEKSNSPGKPHRADRRNYLCIIGKVYRIHVRWNCKYYIIFVPEYRMKKLYGKFRNRVG